MTIEENSLLRTVYSKDSSNKVSHRKLSKPLPNELVLPPIDKKSSSLENVSHRLSPLTPRKKSSLATSPGPLRAIRKMGSTESPCSSGTVSPEPARSRTNSINRSRVSVRRSSITANDITPLINHHPSHDDLIFDYKNQQIRHRQRIAFGTAIKDDDSISMKSSHDSIVRVITPDNGRDDEDQKVESGSPLTTDDFITACVQEADTACIIRTEVPEASDAFTRLKSEFLKSKIDTQLTVPNSPRERSRSIPQSFKWTGFRVITPAPAIEKL